MSTGGIVLLIILGIVGVFPLLFVMFLEASPELIAFMRAWKELRRRD